MNFEKLVTKIRKNRGSKTFVPNFDEDNGNEKAKILFLLEAPGPMAVESGKVSIGNDDPTAKNFRDLLHHAQISPKDYAIWNIVPWYLGNERKIRAATKDDVYEARKFTQELVESMPNLRCIVLMGGRARHAHIFLSSVTTARIVACHHPSQRSMLRPEAKKENEDVLEFVSRTILNNHQGD